MLPLYIQVPTFTEVVNVYMLFACADVVNVYMLFACADVVNVYMLLMCTCCLPVQMRPVPEEEGLYVPTMVKITAVLCVHACISVRRNVPARKRKRL